MGKQLTLTFTPHLVEASRLVLTSRQHPAYLRKQNEAHEQ